MDYKENLYKIFEGKLPGSLRMVFDNGSEEWHRIATTKRVKYLERILTSGYPLDYWLKAYTEQYQYTHKHILNAIHPSLSFLLGQVESTEVKGQIQSWLEESSNKVKSEFYSLTELCLRLLNFEPNERYNFQYSNVPFCVVDSVFSIGVKYESVENVIDRVSKFLGVSKYTPNKQINNQSDQLSTLEFLNITENMSTEDLVKEIFQNRQRTSTTNGIMKVEACMQFMQTLKNHDVFYLQDLPTAFHNKELEKDIKSISGQSSGISLKYFYMLGGLHDLIKPDRMIMAFLKEQTGRKYTINEAQKELLEVSRELSKKLNKRITASFLDNKIWEYQRNLKQYKFLIPV